MLLLSRGPVASLVKSPALDLEETLIGPSCVRQTGKSAIDFATIANPDDENRETAIFDGKDDSVVSDPLAEEPFPATKRCNVRSLAWISCEFCYGTHDACLVRPRERLQILDGRIRPFESVDHWSAETSDNVFVRDALFGRVGEDTSVVEQIFQVFDHRGKLCR